ncbi:MAG: hypothetical protein L0346_27880, partial [Chloroflexi bacterium]|nr:hypothetical protein [Chloroflexota bacterium]
MPNIFAITAATNSIKLNDKRQGEVSFTVSNTSRRAMRGRARIVPEGEAAREWFSLQDEAEQSFALAGTQQYSVRITVPPNAKAGNYLFRLNMVGV